MSPRDQVPDRERLIGRLPDQARQELLDRIVAETQHGSTVEVTWSYLRNVDQLQSVVGRILGLAWAPGGGSSLVLVVDPVDPAERMTAISVAQLVRIRWAYAADPRTLDYDLGLVIAGPPL